MGKPSCCTSRTSFCSPFPCQPFETTIPIPLPPQENNPSFLRSFFYKQRITLSLCALPSLEPPDPLKTRPLSSAPLLSPSGRSPWVAERIRRRGCGVAARYGFHTTARRLINTPLFFWPTFFERRPTPPTFFPTKTTTAAAGASPPPPLLPPSTPSLDLCACARRCNAAFVFLLNGLEGRATAQQGPTASGGIRRNDAPGPPRNARSGADKTAPRDRTIRHSHCSNPRSRAHVPIDCNQNLFTVLAFGQHAVAAATSCGVEIDVETPASSARCCCPCTTSPRQPAAAQGVPSAETAEIRA